MRQVNDKATPSDPNCLSATIWGHPQHETDMGLVSYPSCHPPIYESVPSSIQGAHQSDGYHEGGNKEIDDLPKLDEYTNNDGMIIICLDWCLGICSYERKGKCCFRHATTEHITETFFHELCQVLVPGVQHMLTPGYPEQGPPKKKTQRVRVMPGLWGCWAM